MVPWIFVEHLLLFLFDVLKAHGAWRVGFLLFEVSPMRLIFLFHLCLDRRLVLEAWGLQASSLEVWLARMFWELLV